MSVLRRIAGRMRRAGWALHRATRETLTVDTRQGRLSVSTRDEAIGRLLYTQRHFQHDTTVNALKYLRERGLLPEKGHGVALDIGANIGVISIGMLVNGEFAGAVGIEPEPRNFRLLKHNVTANGLSDRYVPLQFAVSDHAGDLPFALHPNNFGGHHVLAREPADSANVIRVPARRVDVLVDGLPSEVRNAIALVWIDVEGYEGFVFAGGPRLFGRDIPVIAEINPMAITQVGMRVGRFCDIAAGYWSSFSVWRRGARYVQYPISELPRFCEELGEYGTYDDVVFSR